MAQAIQKCWGVSVSVSGPAIFGPHPGRAGPAKWIVVRLDAYRGGHRRSRWHARNEGGRDQGRSRCTPDHAVCNDLD